MRTTTTSMALCLGAVCTLIGLSACSVDPVSPTEWETGVYADTGADEVETGTSEVGLTDTGYSERDGRTADTGADADAGLKGPPYPIVLSHGLAGFEHLAGVEQMSYYYKLPERLREQGEVVMVGEVDPFNNSYERGRQLLRQIEAFLEKTGYAKVNIIAHSQGGLDSRFVAHHAPDKIASVVTISSPHGGTQISDIVLGYVDHPFFRDAVDAITRLFGAPLYDQANEETSLVSGIRQFSDERIREFNERITDRPGVFYASVAGRTDGHLGRQACRTKHAPEFIRAWRYDSDPVDPTFAITEAILDGAGEKDPNDGMVTVENSKWGRFLGCIPADHLDEVGQLLGDSPGRDNGWDYMEFYLKLVEYLRTEGY